MPKKAAATPHSMKGRFCDLKTNPQRRFERNVSPTRAESIISNESKWVNGTVLSYYFFTGPETQKNAMRKAFKIWQDVGIGISFKEVTDRDAADIRIDFKNDGSWSYIGRMIRTIPKSEPTMNIGWDISSDIDTGVHEIGHTLGMMHEHQNPFSGIVWNEQAVYQSLAGPPNHWSQEKTYRNIIRKIQTTEVTGTQWDPDSIMHYPFEPGLISKPEKYSRGLYPAGGLSERDIQWVKSVYPPLDKEVSQLKPFESQPIKISSGGQASFQFIPKENRSYTIKTFGIIDSVLVLSEEGKEGQSYVRGVDDSGKEENGELNVQLHKNKKYSVRIRLLYKDPGSNAAIMIW
jgi:hypothetical protein